MIYYAGENEILIDRSTPDSRPKPPTLTMASRVGLHCPLPTVQGKKATDEHICEVGSTFSPFYHCHVSSLSVLGAVQISVIFAS